MPNSAEGGRQRSFEELGRPLAGVTFCVVDLETTGGSPAGCGITEIGALKVRLGERQGSFQTLVKPDEMVPAFIRLLTGISDEMLVDAPPIHSVLPSFLEFVRDSVLVAHNARFDVGFLNAALVREGYAPLANDVVDTAALARKILAGEVRNNRLETLARHLRCVHQPCHRAFADVLATNEVLHHLIERAAGYGVTTLEDLLAMSATRMDGTFGKIKLAEALPSATGIYRFVGSTGQTLYVGKATDLRARVRSYFYGDPRRKIRDLLRETQTISFETHASTLEAEVAEARAIASEVPPYNRRGKGSASWYLKVSSRKPRIAPARAPVEDGSVYLGPLPSLKLARMLVDTVRDATAVHRCSVPSRCHGCAFSALGVCVGVDRDAHGAEVELVVDALTGDPGLVVQPLEDKMRRLARQERFEEAAELRDRARTLTRWIERSIEMRALIDAGEVLLLLGDRAVLLVEGQLAAACGAGDRRAEDLLVSLRHVARWEPVGSWLTPRASREVRAVVSWLHRHTPEVQVLHVEGTWSVPVRARLTDAFLVAERGPRGGRVLATDALAV
ncbi:MAG: DEDD exonuclease domain-containing protein [Actinomycetota bacterium]|nr:DEDD exonuclease domain-containing protein [Actinomycetota bacterium]